MAKRTARRTRKVSGTKRVKKPANPRVVRALEIAVARGDQLRHAIETRIAKRFRPKAGTKKR